MRNVEFFSYGIQLGSQGLTYGWRRTELLGGLFNGLFLVSMSIFVFLESIPKFIQPEGSTAQGKAFPNVSDVNTDGDLQFMIVSSVGIVLNVIGTILFSIHGGGHG